MNASPAEEPAVPSVVLIDTSAWLWHFRHHDPFVERLLARAMAVGHLDIAGELAMGHAPRSTRFRDRVLSLPQLPEVGSEKLLSIVESWGITGQGVGWVDAGLLAACRFHHEPIAIYSRDRRLSVVARNLGIRVVAPPPERSGEN